MPQPAPSFITLRPLAPLLLICAAMSLSACGSEDQAATQAPSQEAAASQNEAIGVFTTEVEALDLVTPISGSGSLAPSKVTDIGPSVDGVIETIYVDVGARVDKGDPLFKTRDTQIRLQVEELTHQVALAEAELKNARSSLARAASLRRKGAASQGRLDDARAAADIAEARLGIAQSKLKLAEDQLQESLVAAPYAGVITAKSVYEGRFMATRGGGGGMGGASGVVQLMQLDPAVAIVNVPEVHLPKLSVGTPAKIRVDGMDTTLEGEIGVINDFVDPDARAIEVRIGLPNADYKIKPGLFARAQFFPPARPALRVARQAVLGFDRERYVYVPVESESGLIAERRAVEVRELDARYLEIVEGLSAGDAVLVGPSVPRLNSGARIRVEDRAGEVPSPRSEAPRSEAAPGPSETRRGG